MEHITLFTDILPEEQERMRVCFKVREKVFQNGETIMEYSSSMKKIGLIQEGRAVLYCCDEDGNEYVIVFHIFLPNQIWSAPAPYKTPFPLLC